MMVDGVPMEHWRLQMVHKQLTISFPPELTQLEYISTHLLPINRLQNGVPVASNELFLNLVSEAIAAGTATASGSELSNIV